MDSNAIVKHCLPELQTSFCDFMLSRDHYADMVRGAAMPAALLSAEADTTHTQPGHTTEIYKQFLSIVREYCGGQEHDWQEHLASASISDEERSNLLSQLNHAHLFLQRCKLGFLHKMMAVFYDLCKDNAQATASQVKSGKTLLLRMHLFLKSFAVQHAMAALLTETCRCTAQNA